MIYKKPWCMYKCLKRFFYDQYVREIASVSLILTEWFIEIFIIILILGKWSDEYF